MFYLLKIQRSVEVRTFARIQKNLGPFAGFYFRLHAEHHAVNDYRLAMLPALFCCS